MGKLIHCFGPEGYTPLPEGIYLSAVQSTHLVEGKYGKCFEIRFIILEGKFSGKVIGKRFKAGRVRDLLWQVVKILTGAEYDEINELDFETLKGRRCKIQVEKIWNDKKKRNQSRICEFIQLTAGEDDGRNQDDDTGRLGF